MKNKKGYKWSVLLVVTLVSFITNVDSTITIIGLPKIMQGLDMNVAMGLLTITSYIIASTVLLLPAGKLADIVGNKKIFIWGFIIFTIGTVLCGIANSGISLIFYRIIQGVGSALALATATPIIIKTFPDKQLGLALGINSTSWVIGALVGPVIGGALISEYGWRTIFFITVPFAIIGVIGAFIVLEGTNVNGKFKVDLRGIISFGICLTLIMLVLSEGETWGMFYTIYNLGRALSQTLVILTIELSIPSELVSRVLVGIDNFNRAQEAGNLIHSIGLSFKFFSIFFIITLILAASSWRGKMKKIA
ncbi:MFS transporter [Clostridium sp. YIM B02551]|uniref:MFS transporter n=1 Tax=Clostridium sp. YIM B02551 TaxID=2910679 RepID=UPI001EEA77C5|nr:MFS transporter [Clostridium sp. YIM B02551]